MITKARLVLFLLFLTPGLCHATDRISYDLLWKISSSGSALKTYTVRYEGKGVLSRLKKYTSKNLDVFSYFENVLPLVQTSDKLIKRKKLSKGVYRWVYRTQNVFKTNQDKIRTIHLWLPPLDDPIITPWKTIGNSKIKFKAVTLETKNRFVIEGPWRFTLNEKPSPLSLISKGFYAAYNVKLLNKKRTAIELTSTIRTKKADSLNQHDTDRLWELYEKWLQSRVKTIVLKARRIPVKKNAKR